MLAFINRLSGLINSIIEPIVFVLTVVLTILTATGVFFRYVLDSPIIWLSEVTLLVFAWMIFFAVSIAFKKQEHISLEFLSNALPRGGNRVLKVLILLIVIAFLLIAIIASTEIIKNTMPIKYNTINVSTGWLYLSFPTGAIVSVIHLVNIILHILFNKEEPVGPEKITIV